ncbi:alpha/beta hydrolase fold domain-containing protein [Silvibacterium dinghuense]|uniref:Alpha/beta hydrolase n=1 Tax=Silvibacterium dinghuense TaxID=1560006 RepID=A0A4Q1SIL1_9BACT|nr:alpha/beta hydrolase fold domain-containing protein [Silvibacterium dinghuense]RXS97245.1 alpha/beta hydrolase [Silvibacterium dinghuense]
MKTPLLALCLLPSLALAQTTSQTTEQTAPKTDASYIAPDGTAHVSRIVPVPKTISPEAQAMLAKPASDAAKPQTLAERRAGTNAWQARAGAASKAVYPVDIQKDTIAGVPVLRVTPPTIGAGKDDRVLMCVHGGGFNVDSGSLTESIPIAALSQTRVVSVLYRLAPEHPFPAAIDDTIAVYKELLKTHKPGKIALYGTSAGAILTAEVAVEMKKLGLPLPGALGVFSGLGDFSQPTDSQAMYALNGLSGHLEPPDPGAFNKEYFTSTDPKDPVLSPLYADVHGFPPTLFITSGRDAELSGTTILQRHFYEAGVDAPLVVFEALPHAFWNDVSLPESREAYRIMAAFLDSRLGR